MQNSSNDFGEVLLVAVLPQSKQDDLDAEIEETRRLARARGIELYELECAPAGERHTVVAFAALKGSHISDEELGLLHPRSARRVLAYRFLDGQAPEVAVDHGGDYWVPPVAVLAAQVTTDAARMAPDTGGSRQVGDLVWRWLLADPHEERPAICSFKRTVPNPPVEVQIGADHTTAA